jgi:hypothetical protein
MLPPMRRLSTLLLISSALLAAGCRGPARAAHDIRALHGSDGSVLSNARLSGTLTSGRGAAPRTGLGAWVLQVAYPEEFGAGDLLHHAGIERRAQRVGRPQARCLEALLVLDRDRRTDRVSIGTRVELAAFLAERSRSKLVRERAVRLLGGEAAALGLTDFVQAVPDAGSAGEVRARFEALAAATAALEAGGSLTALAEPARGLAQAPLELEDLRRVLRVATALAEALTRSDYEAAGLAELHQAGLRGCVSAALGRAVRDPAPVVAAAAVEQVLALDRSRLYELLGDALELSLWEIAAVCCESLLADGLPEGDPPLDLWLERLVLITQTVDDVESVEDGRLRLLAAETLGALAPTDLESLRSEDWMRWYWRHSDRILGDVFGEEGSGAESPGSGSAPPPGG